MSKVCTVCGKLKGLVTPWYNDKCMDCYSTGRVNERAEKEKSEIEAINSEIEAIMLTTETAPNLKITRRIEVITAEVAYGTNIFKDLFTDVRDIVGGRATAIQNTVRDARRAALHELKREAYEIGANAVVGIDLDYVELSSFKSMVMLVASGTAVIIED